MSVLAALVGKPSEFYVMNKTAARLRPHVLSNLEAAVSAWRQNNVPAAWEHLARAHILSQPAAGLHTRVHLAMLTLGLRQRDWREVLGQLVRVSIAAIGSWTGRYPLGNTGLGRDPMLLPMSVPADLAEILAEERH